MSIKRNMNKFSIQLSKLTRIIYDKLEYQNLKKFKYTALIELIKQEFVIDYYGDHGINHWQRVYENTQKLSRYYEVDSEVFELFSLLHDSKRENEFRDKNHGKRAAVFAQELIDKGLIKLHSDDLDRLLYACANHTYSNKNHPLYNDLVVQICFDSDRLDIDRVGFDVDKKYLSTGYAKSLVN